MNRVIVVVNGGMVTAVYADSKMMVDVLDYDSMRECDLNNIYQSEEYAEYVNMESILENDETMKKVW